MFDYGVGMVDVFHFIWNVDDDFFMVSTAEKNINMKQFPREQKILILKIFPIAISHYTASSDLTNLHKNSTEIF